MSQTRRTLGGGCAPPSSEWGGLSVELGGWRKGVTDQQLGGVWSGLHTKVRTLYVFIKKKILGEADIPPGVIFSSSHFTSSGLVFQNNKAGQV